MITKDNLPDLLKAIGFNKRGTTYDKSIGSAKLEVNFTKGEIVYPAGLTVNQKQTCNLNANENFVVLECVHRLPVQTQVVTEVLALEQTIAEAQAVIAATPIRKQAIMQRYL